MSFESEGAASVAAEHSEPRLLEGHGRTAPLGVGGRGVSRFARTRYAVVAVLCVMYFITYVDRVNLSVAAPELARSLHLSKTELGFLFSVFAYPYAAMQILGGWFSDKYGPRVTLTVLGVIWSLATIGTGLCGGFATLLLSRVLLGVGEGGAFPTATRALTWWLPKGERASLTALPTVVRGSVAR